MCQQRHKCFITIQTLTNAATVSLPDNVRIRKGRVTSVQMRQSADVLKSVQGTTLAVQAVINTAHVYFKDSNGKEIAAPMPLNTLQRNLSSPEPLAVNWTNVDPTQTQIILDTAAVGYSATACFEFIFGIDCDNCE